MTQGIYLSSDTSETSADSLLKKAETYLKTKKADAFLCRLPADFDEAKKQAFVNVLRPFFQTRDIAFLVNEDLSLCANTDGIQIKFSPTVAAVRKKYPDIALGVVCRTRHEAMIAGEKGADYIAFAGENAADLCAWWGDLFTVPCVFEGKGTCDTADFVAVTL